MQPLASSRALRLILAALCLALIGGALALRPASAQAPLRLASMAVSFWPEYDRPTMLVILDGELEPAATLPASLSVRIPARAGQPHAVATTGTTGELLAADYTTQADGDDIIVMFQAQSLGFRVEYYDPALVLDDEARQFSFDWRTDYAIDATVVRVQEPVGARDLAGEPALTSLGAGADGLNYHETSWGALQPGDRASLHLSYAKTGNALTAEAVGAEPVPQSVPPATASNTTWPWIAGGVVLAVAAGGAGVYALRRSRRLAPARASHRSRRRSSPGQRRPAQPAASGPARFCTQCGQALVAGDRFCRNCGAGVTTS